MHHSFYGVKQWFGVCQWSEESKEAKAMPGVWIKPVWGSRQEVDDLDLAIQQALELEQIDCSKYFTKYGRFSRSDRADMYGKVCGKNAYITRVCKIIDLLLEQLLICVSPKRYKSTAKGSHIMEWICFSDSCQYVE